MRPGERRRRRLLAPLAVAVAVALLVRLALWQWDRGQDSGRLLHYTYAVEWLLVAALLLGWAVLRPWAPGRSRPPDDSYDAAGRVIGPPLRPGEELPPSTRDRVARRLGRQVPPPAPAPPARRQESGRERRTGRA